MSNKFEKPSFQHYIASTKGIPVMPSDTSSTRHSIASLPQLTHCLSFDSTYGQVLGTSRPFTAVHSAQFSQPEICFRLLSPAQAKHTVSGQQQMANTSRIRPDLAAARSIDSHARLKTDKYIKTVRKSARQKSRQERIARLDDAIFELEHIYEQLRLNDEDLLDRAERRDLPSHLQLLRFEPAVESNNLTDSGQLLESDTDKLEGHDALRSPRKRFASTQIGHFPSHLNSFNNTNSNYQSNRTPPMRRSAIPDLIGDDLAVRRLQPSPLQGSKSTGDLLAYHPTKPYMSHCAAYDDRSLFTTFVPNQKTPGQISEPNPQLDDLSYRRMRQADGANVLPPPPPFGIPLQPIQFNPLHDYMHLKSNNSSANTPVNTTKIKRFLRKASTADPLQDDLALRSWRKDFQETSRTLKPCLPSPMNEQQTAASQVNTSNPYSNVLRSNSSSFFNLTEPLSPVNTKSVIASYLEKCKQGLRPTRLLTFEDDEKDVSSQNDSKSKKGTYMAGSHVGGRLFSKIQQNLQSFDKENQIQHQKSNEFDRENTACFNTPKNRIYNRSTFEGQISKSPSPSG